MRVVLSIDNIHSLGRKKPITKQVLMLWASVPPYAPHLGAPFEGYYSKFRLPSQASVLLIVSAVPAAARDAIQQGAKPSDRKAFMVYFAYVSPDSRHSFSRQFFPDGLDIQLVEGEVASSSPQHGFRTRWDSGEFAWEQESPDGTRNDHISWTIETAEIRFVAETTNPCRRSPWQTGDLASTPAGIFSLLPLPIQWHVHSLASTADFELEIKSDEPDSQVHPSDRTGLATAHIEKNWAQSFPKSYIWVQARDDERNTGVTLSGGTALPGVEAFLVGYHGQETGFLGFRPPTSIRLLGISLGLHSEIDFNRRLAVIDIKGWFRRVRVACHAAPETFFDLAAPLPTGHAPGYCTQSFGATIQVEVYERSWPWAAWRLAETETFERGSLEFGGGHYKPHTA